MHGNRNKLARVGSALLAATLMVFAVAKAQGCQRPVEMDEPSAQALEPEASPEAQPAAAQTTAQAAAVEADAGAADAGPTIQPLPSDLLEREVFPATKAGPVFRPTPNQAPK